MKDLTVVTREEKEDHLQDITLLTLQLMKKYSFTEEAITGKQFLTLLRRAFERDLIDRLERRCKTVVWGAFGEKKKVTSKIVSVKEFDTEYEYKEVNDRDGRVVLPAVIQDPESGYLIFHIVGRMKVTFSDQWEILRDLLANEGLCDYDSARLPPYLQLRKNFVRISAKVVCDAYGATERQRKNLLRSVREFLAAEGVTSLPVKEKRDQSWSWLM